MDAGFISEADPTFNIFKMCNMFSGNFKTAITIQ